ncbi:MAG: aldehyde dehydrogenase family protein [Chloroflexi bacterium]|nr:aldehyde dehydrogenase family protein [Chloroflexota bacterium]
MAIETERRRWDGKLYIDGSFSDGSGGEPGGVLEKATGSRLGSYAVASGEDLDRAVRAARSAQPGWAARSYEERALLLRQVARAMEERADELADAIVRETGSIRGKAQYEVHASQNELYEAAGLASRATAQIVPSANTGKLNIVQRIPVGVVGVITPWNFPLILGMRAIAPALALGNTVVLKPASYTPMTGGQLLADLFETAGAPAGIINVVTGSGADVGVALAAHPDVDMIHFTGSSEVGREIGAVGGRALKKLSMELGGNAAFVVLDDADVDLASMVGAWSSFHYQGQTCITANRHIVMRSVADAYRAAIAERARRMTVGDPAGDDVSIGPVISESQRDRAHALLQGSLEQGARIVEGGTYDGLFYRPTVVDEVRPGMPLYDQEIFAPIAPITVVDTEEEALRLTNETPYGLVNALYTGDLDRGLRFAERVRSGMVHINDSTALDEAHVPFGGLGASGMGGRSGGEANLEEFTERRWISLQRTTVHYPY